MTQKTETIWTKAFIRIFILNVIMSMGQFIASTLLPKHVEQMGAPASVIGVVAGMFAITAIAIRPVVMAGRLLHGIGMGSLVPVMLFLAINALPEGRMASGGACRLCAGAQKDVA